MLSIEQKYIKLSRTKGVQGINTIFFLITQNYGASVSYEKEKQLSPLVHIKQRIDTRWDSKSNYFIYDPILNDDFVLTT